MHPILQWLAWLMLAACMAAIVKVLATDRFDDEVQ